MRENKNGNMQDKRWKKKVEESTGGVPLLGQNLKISDSNPNIGMLLNSLGKKVNMFLIIFLIQKRLQCSLYIGKIIICVIQNGTKCGVWCKIGHMRKQGGVANFTSRIAIWYHLLVTFVSTCIINLEENLDSEMAQFQTLQFWKQS